jgi:transposase-like protein
MFTTLLIRNLLNNEHNLPEFESVLSEVFRQQLEEAVNDVLNYELEQFLGYERYRHTDKTDSRNGFKPDRTIDTKYGPITIKMPRDRLGLFASSLIPAYVRRTEGTERSVIDLFDLGLTNSEITEAVDRMFGAKVSKGTVSNITNRIISNIDSYKNPTMASEYAVIYIDATMMPLRRDTVQKEAVHIALGIRTDGTKEILDYSIAPNESKTNWKDMIETIRERGVERVALFCTDGLNGMEEVINSVYPSAKIQRCLLHVQRNISSKCRVSDRAEITEDFKSVYTSADKTTALSELEKFYGKWNRKYPKIMQSLRNNSNMFTFYDFPREIRRSIYTTNMIESYNKQLKRHFKSKEQFPTEQSEEKYLVSQFERYNEKFLNRIHKGFGKVTDFWFSDSCTCAAVTEG